MQCLRNGFAGHAIKSDWEEVSENEIGFSGFREWNKKRGCSSFFREKTRERLPGWNWGGCWRGIFHGPLRARAFKEPRDAVNSFWAILFRGIGRRLPIRVTGQLQHMGISGTKGSAKPYRLLLFLSYPIMPRREALLPEIKNSRRGDPPAESWQGYSRAKL